MTSTAAGVAQAPTHNRGEAVNETVGFSHSTNPSNGSDLANSTQESSVPATKPTQKRRNIFSRAWNKESDHEDDSDARTVSQSSLDEKKDNIYELEQTETAQTSFEAAANGMLYNEGQLVLIPAPSPDPRDPLNLSKTRKGIALGFLCVFGALAASAELILGAMLPVFAIYYAGIDPAELLITIEKVGGLQKGADPLKLLGELPNAQPISKIYLLASLPVLMFGVANLILIPAAIAIGRRPVILFCGLCAIGGCLWSGFSSSLDSHLIARCVQALGAGTVESLIPFIVQDMVHVHERNTAISGVFAAQGVIIIGLGIAAPYMIIYLNWRYVYYITAAGAGLFLIGVFLFCPESRYPRSRAMMAGERPIVSDEERRNYRPRTWAYDLQLVQGKMEFRKGVQALIDTLTTFFYPHIFFITMLNSAMIGAAFASGYTISPALLTAPYSWPFLHLGLCLIPVLIAAILVGLLTGKLADILANWTAKRRGIRVPENQIINLVVPTVTGIVGSVIFGLAGDNQDKYPWPVFLLGLGLMSFGFLGANTVGAVYVLESYPNLAGPALVNIASFRCLIAFLLSFKVSDWVAELGYFDSMIIYTGIISLFACFLPVVYVWGPAWRKRWPGPPGSAI